MLRRRAGYPDALRNARRWIAPLSHTAPIASRSKDPLCMGERGRGVRATRRASRLPLALDAAPAYRASRVRSTCLMQGSLWRSNSTPRPITRSVHHSRSEEFRCLAHSPAGRRGSTSRVHRPASSTGCCVRPAQPWPMTQASASARPRWRCGWQAANAPAPAVGSRSAGRGANAMRRASSPATVPVARMATMLRPGAGAAWPASRASRTARRWRLGRRWPACAPRCTPRSPSPRGVIAASPPCPSGCRWRMSSPR